MRCKILLLLVLAAACRVVSEELPDLAQEIDDFFRDSEVRMFSVAPGGVNLSYDFYEGASRRSVMTINFEEGAKRQLKPDPGEDVYGLGWAGPNAMLYAKSELSSSRHGGVYSCESLLHDLRRLDNRGSLPRVVHLMPLDPDRCAVVNLRDPGRLRDLRYMNVKTGEFVGRVKNPGGVVRYFLDTRGNVRLGYGRGETEGESQWLYYLGDQEWETLELPEEVADWTFFDDGDVAWAELTEGPRVKLRQYDFKKRAFVGETIASETVDVTVDGFVKDPTTLQLMGIRIDETRPRMVWFDPGLEALAGQLEKAFPQSVITILGANAVSSDLFFKVESDINPGSYFALSQQGKVTPFAYENPRLLRYDIPRTQAISFKNREGQEIHGFLTLPKLAEGEKAPLLVMPHGGPHVRDTLDFHPARQFFAYKGFATLTVNYRGSAGCGKSFWNQDGFESVLQRSVDDVVDATKWALETQPVDANRAAIMGGSFGGYIALEAVCREPELYRCAVGAAGVYDWHKQLSATRSQVGKNFDWFHGGHYGDLKERQAAYDALSPFYHADRIKVPVLLYHGKSDDRVEPSQSRRMRAELEKAGVEVELVMQPWGRHGFIDEKSRVSYVTMIWDYFEKNLR